MGKLPSDLGAQVFADSPLRSTTAPKKPPLAAVPTLAEEPVAAVSMLAEEPVAAIDQVSLLPSPMPITAPSAALPATAAHAAITAAPAQQIKMTIYLSKEQVDAIEEEVFRRRRGGDRIGNTDLMREIVDAWRARR